MWHNRKTDIDLIKLYTCVRKKGHTKKIPFWKYISSQCPVLFAFNMYTLYLTFREEIGTAYYG